MTTTKKNAPGTRKTLNPRQVVGMLDTMMNHIANTEYTFRPRTLPRRRSPPPANVTRSVTVTASKIEFYKQFGYDPQSPKRRERVKDKLVDQLFKTCETVAKPYIASLVNLEKNKNMATDPRFTAGKGWRFLTVKNVDETTAKRNDVTGFAIGRFLDKDRFGDKIFFIEVICKKNGTAHRMAAALLMQAIEDEARRNGCRKVWLASLPQATNAYKRMGYNFGPVTNSNRMYPPGAQRINVGNVIAATETGRSNIFGVPIPSAVPVRLFRIRQLGEKQGNGTYQNHDDDPGGTILMTKKLPLLKNSTTMTSHRLKNRGS